MLRRVSTPSSPLRNFIMMAFHVLACFLILLLFYFFIWITYQKVFYFRLLHSFNICFQCNKSWFQFCIFFFAELSFFWVPHLTIHALSFLPQNFFFSAVSNRTCMILRHTSYVCIYILLFCIFNFSWQFELVFEFEIKKCKLSNANRDVCKFACMAVYK